MNLHDEYKRVVKETVEITLCYYIYCIEEPVKYISSEKFSKDDVVQLYNVELMALLQEKDFGLSSKMINEFSQKMGECHFYCLCLDRDIKLTRLKENRKTKVPDFSLNIGDTKLYFEVKTPSIVGGDFALDEDIERGFDQRHNFQSSRKNGFNTAFSEISPYGKMIKKFGHIFGPIKALSEKIAQNFKKDQFSNDNTFMVINLVLIHHFITLPEELKPVYALRNDPESVVSGIFWMLAFRKIGMAVFGIPLTTSGLKYGIDGYCDENGVLIDREEIEGLLLITNPPRNKSEMWGLFRKRTLDNECIRNSLIRFTDYRFNDESNTRGMTINRNNRDFAYNDFSK